MNSHHSHSFTADTVSTGHRRDCTGAATLLLLPVLHLPPSNNCCGPTRNQPAPKHVYTQIKAKSPVLTVILFPNSSVEIMFKFLIKQDFFLATYSFTAPPVPRVVQGGAQCASADRMESDFGLRAHFHSTDTGSTAQGPTATVCLSTSQSTISM